jgi:hypothetical protein
MLHNQTKLNIPENFDNIYEKRRSWCWENSKCPKEPFDSHTQKSNKLIPTL